MDCYDTKSLEHHAMPIVYVKWKDGKAHPDAENRLLTWLKVRLDVESIELMRGK